MRTIPATKPVRGWWFGGETLPHGDGRPVAVGTVHEVVPPIVACKRGLHCSRRALDALYYASGCQVWRVEVWGETDDGETDKLASQYRRYLWSLDATAILRRFACRCALDVLPEDVPAVVREYLVLAARATDDQRAAAWASAWDASWASYRDASWNAAWAAAKNKQASRLDSMLTAEAMRLGLTGARA